MIQAIIGTKIKQTQMFDDRGFRMPITIVSTGSCIAVRPVKTTTTSHIQLGFGHTKHMHNAQKGILKKAGITLTPRVLKEVDLPDGVELPPGTEILAEQVFALGDKVRVTGVSKGKGFAGVVKRHHFRGGPKTHGQSDRERAPGSIGSTTTPGRVFVGKRMAGRMGSDTVTVRNLTVVKIDEVAKCIYIKGLVPGGKKSLLVISKEA